MSDEQKYLRKYARGNWVRYIPGHAKGDMHHKDCEDGVVSSVSDDGTIVFVKYDNASCTMTTGEEPYTAQATDYYDLKFMGLRR
jgi:hypothetical protein